MGRPAKPLEVRRKAGNPGKQKLPQIIEIGRAPAAPPVPSHLKASGKKAWKNLWTAGRIWLGESDMLAVKLACEQADQVAALRRQASAIKRPELRLQFLYAIQKAESSYLSTLSQLGFTPTARARLGLVVAQAAETESRLSRFTDHRVG